MLRHLAPCRKPLGLEVHFDDELHEANVFVGAAVQTRV